MSRRSPLLRASLGALGAVALTASLSGCTLISTLAGGGPTTTPTTTSTSSSKPTESPTSKPTESPTNKPTTTPSSSPTSSPGSTDAVLQDSKIELEMWLQDQYKSEYGNSATITCPVASTFDVYVGLTIDCSVVESGGSKYTLKVEVTEVTSTGYTMSFDRR